MATKVRNYSELVEYLKKRVQTLKSDCDFYQNKSWNAYNENYNLRKENQELKNLITFHLDAPLDMVKNAVDIVIGDDGFRSKEVLEVLLFSIVRKKSFFVFDGICLVCLFKLITNLPLFF